MKSLSLSLQAHLDGGTTTLAWCWKLTRRDGVTFGFTDHDCDITFAATTYESATSFNASEIKDTLGLAVDNLEVASALSSNRLEENDLAAGLYDEAAVEIWRVNWADVTQRVLMRKGSLGEVRRAGNAFSAEVRGLAHYLNQPMGRLYQYTCDATFGDRRCTVPSAAAAYTATATVSAVASPRLISVTGIEAFDAGWYSRGLATYISGANTNHATEVRRHSKTGTSVTLEFWQQAPRTPAIGDTLSLTTGCDKFFRTCRDKFNNSSNYRGFPHMPGNDLLTSPARAGEQHDGTALR
jgi:uncharacterized phage protein (TIGR02218 family)